MPKAPLPVRSITASHLYDLVACRHRVASDFTRPRAERTPADETSRALIERGLELEARTAARLGGVRIAFRPDDPTGAFSETLATMRAGEELLHQGVLVCGRRLAIPDLLRKVKGASTLGDHHYEAGDIKSGLAPRTDQVLQVVFAARLLEEIQGRRPTEGFLILADGSESRFALDEVWDSGMLALEALEAIADGRLETFPFYSQSCSRCRWSSTCLPELARGPDLSLVAGMTWTRKRILMAHGVTTVDALAALGADGIGRLERAGVAADGLRQLQKQAEALVTGRILRPTERRSSRPPVPAPPENIDESFLVCEWDPLGEGHPFLFAWGTRRGGTAAEVVLSGVETHIMLEAGETAPALRRIEAWVDGSRGPLYHFGSAASGAIEWLAERHPGAVSLDRAGARLRDLAPLVRRGGYLPVRRYVFPEIVAALEGRPLPPLDDPQDAPFLWAQHLRRGTEGDWSRRLADRARSDLQGLTVLRDWSRGAILGGPDESGGQGGLGAPGKLDGSGPPSESRRLAGSSGSGGFGGPDGPGGPGAAGGWDGSGAQHGSGGPNGSGALGGWDGSGAQRGSGGPDGSGALGGWHGSGAQRGPGGSDRPELPQRDMP